MKKLKIVFENKNLIVVDKEPKKLTIATDKKSYNNLYHEVREYVKNNILKIKYSLFID